MHILRTRLSYNMTAADCAGAIFCPMMKLALETPYNSARKEFITLAVIYQIYLFLCQKTVFTWNN